MRFLVKGNYFVTFDYYKELLFVNFSGTAPLQQMLPAWCACIYIAEVSVRKTKLLGIFFLHNTYEAALS